MPVNKKGYYQGGGGVNEPTPGEKKYKSDPALVVQPRFKEPFYRNYDLYTIPGMEDIGPGTGYHGLQNYKSVQEFLKDRRHRMKDRYVADDSWILDDNSKTKKNPGIKARAALFERIIKTAEGEVWRGKDPRKADIPSGCKDSDIEYTENRDAYFCKKCGHLGFNGPYEPKPTVEELHSGQDYTQNVKVARMPGMGLYHSLRRKFGPTKRDLQEALDQMNDINNGPNYDLGKGLYQEMSDGKVDSVEEFRKETDHGPGALMNITKKKNNTYDINHIDFPIDDQINTDPIESETSDNLVGQSNLTGGKLDEYLPKDDFEGKLPTALDFGRDYDDGDIMEKLFNKYLGPSQTELFGLPDGMEDSDLDAEQTMDVEEPFTGTSDIGTNIYEDKWNI